MEVNRFLADHLDDFLVHEGDLFSKNSFSNFVEHRESEHDGTLNGYVLNKYSKTIDIVHKFFNDLNWNVCVAHLTLTGTIKLSDENSFPSDFVERRVSQPVIVFRNQGLQREEETVYLQTIQALKFPLCGYVNNSKDSKAMPPQEDSSKSFPSDYSPIQNHHSGSDSVYVTHLNSAFGLGALAAREYDGRVGMEQRRIILQNQRESLIWNSYEEYIPGDFALQNEYKTWQTSRQRFLTELLRKLPASPHDLSVNQVSRLWDSRLPQYNRLYRTLVIFDNLDSPKTFQLNGLSRFILNEFKYLYGITDTMSQLTHLNYLLDSFQLDESYLHEIILCADYFIEFSPKQTPYTIKERMELGNAIKRLDEIIRVKHFEKEALFHLILQKRIDASTSQFNGFDMIVLILERVTQLKISTGVDFLEFDDVLKMSLKECCYDNFRKIRNTLNKGQHLTANEIFHLINKIKTNAENLIEQLNKYEISYIRAVYYAELSKVVVEYFNHQIERCEKKPEMFRNDLALMYHLNQLDQDWINEVYPCIHLWRQKAFKLTTLWLKVLQRSCLAFLRNSILTGNFKFLVFKSTTPNSNSRSSSITSYTSGSTGMGINRNQRLSLQLANARVLQHSENSPLSPLPIRERTSLESIESTSSDGTSSSSSSSSSFTSRSSTVTNGSAPISARSLTPVEEEEGPNIPQANNTNGFNSGATIRQESSSEKERFCNSESFVNFIVIMVRLTHFTEGLLNILMPSESMADVAASWEHIEKHSIVFKMKRLELLRHLVLSYAVNITALDICGKPNLAKMSFTSNIYKLFLSLNSNKRIWTCRHKIEGRSCEEFPRDSARNTLEKYEPISQRMLTRMNDIACLVEIFPKLIFAGLDNGPEVDQTSTRAELSYRLQDFKSGLIKILANRINLFVSNCIRVVFTAPQDLWISALLHSDVPNTALDNHLTTLQHYLRPDMFQYLISMEAIKTLRNVKDIIDMLNTFKERAVVVSVLMKRLLARFCDCFNQFRYSLSSKHSFVYNELCFKLDCFSDMDPHIVGGLFLLENDLRLLPSKSYLEEFHRENLENEVLTKEQIILYFLQNPFPGNDEHWSEQTARNLFNRLEHASILQQSNIVHRNLKLSHEDLNQFSSERISYKLHIQMMSLKDCFDKAHYLLTSGDARHLEDLEIWLNLTPSIIAKRQEFSDLNCREALSQLTIRALFARSKMQPESRKVLNMLLRFNKVDTNFGERLRQSIGANVQTMLRRFVSV